MLLSFFLPVLLIFSVKNIGRVVSHGGWVSTILIGVLWAESMLILTVLILSLLWLILIPILMILFRTTQFLLLRIVEYPKGPVLGLSGLLIGIAALIKAFL